MKGKDKTKWRIINLTLATLLGTLIWIGGNVMQAASPPIPASSTSTRLLTMHMDFTSKLPLISVQLQAELKEISDSHLSKIISNLQHLRNSGDEDFTPKRIDAAFSPFSKKVLRRSLGLYTELWWGLDQHQSSKFLWRELFKEITFNKAYPNY